MHMFKFCTHQLRIENIPPLYSEPVMLYKTSECIARSITSSSASSCYPLANAINDTPPHSSSTVTVSGKFLSSLPVLCYLFIILLFVRLKHFYLEKCYVSSYGYLYRECFTKRTCIDKSC